MNQPKFKFGDKVESARGVLFVITQVEFLEKTGTYSYSHIGGNWHSQETLELYQEPQKKKLYAYRIDLYGFSGGADINGDEVRFTPNIEMVSFGHRGSNDWVRAPEYDIEYPEAE